jgi:hypothetical protein
MESKTLFEVDKTDTKKVVVRLETYKDMKFLAVKEMWRRDESDVWKHSKKVVTFGYEPALLLLKGFQGIKQEDLEGLKETKKEADKNGDQRGTETGDS